ncbi:MAG: hypothetical protein C4536_08690 [Actinobacteria bacterium]|nr:MAG: hypothetical protein C4536_08690 [Actinomycetota bacterium]
MGQEEGGSPISKRYAVIIIVMVVSCIVLIGISYLMLDILSGMVVTPKTLVKEVAGEGALSVPLEGMVVLSMQVSEGGRFLAYMAKPEAGGNAVLRVVGLEGESREALFDLEIQGTRLAWLGSSTNLVYEDAGDIHLLGVVEGTSENLTASPAYDADPIPSPDGRYILWTISGRGSESERPGFWVMAADGSGKEFLADTQALPAWDPAGGKVVSRSDIISYSMDEDISCFLQMAIPGREGWEYYAECDSDVRYIWWPAQDNLLYVAPEAVKDQDTIKGVWVLVEEPGKLKRVASTDGLGGDTALYLFYPSLQGERLAYVGDEGMEYMDYEERAIYRYPGLGARPPLAWNEAAGEIYYSGQGGIYRVALGGE